MHIQTGDDCICANKALTTEMLYLRTQCYSLDFAQYFICCAYKKMFYMECSMLSMKSLVWFYYNFIWHKLMVTSSRRSCSHSPPPHPSFQPSGLAHLVFSRFNDKKWFDTCNTSPWSLLYKLILIFSWVNCSRCSEVHCRMTCGSNHGRSGSTSPFCLRVTWPTIPIGSYIFWLTDKVGSTNTYHEN